MSTTDLTPESLTALKKLCENASPGPWRAMRCSRNQVDGLDGQRVLIQHLTHPNMFVEMAPDAPGMREWAGEDLNFIAQARTYLPLLIEFAEHVITQESAIRVAFDTFIDECTPQNGYERWKIAEESLWKAIDDLMPLPQPPGGRDEKD